MAHASLLTFAYSAAPPYLTLQILVLGIGLCESYRVGAGWATPVGEDFNQLRVSTSSPATQPAISTAADTGAECSTPESLPEQATSTCSMHSPDSSGCNPLLMLQDDYEPGNLGFDPLGLKPTNPAALKDLQTRELNNGRLAMLSIIAFWLQEIRDPSHTSECCWLHC